MAWQTTPSSLLVLDLIYWTFYFSTSRRQNSESWKRRIGNWNEPLHTMLGIPSTSLSIIVFSFPRSELKFMDSFEHLDEWNLECYTLEWHVCCVRSRVIPMVDVMCFLSSLFYIARSRLRVAFESYFTIVWLGILYFLGRLDKCEMRKIDGSSETKLDILWMFTQTNDERRRRRRTVRATTKLSRQARSLQLSSATKKKS